MDGRWLIDLHAVFDGSRRLAGGEFHRLPQAAVLIDGSPLGLPALYFEEFLDRAREVGLRRLFLMVSDDLGPDQGWRGTVGHAFVLTGVPFGSWQVRSVPGSSRLWDYSPASIPKLQQLDIAEATDRLRDMLSAIRHPNEGYQKSVREALQILDGGPLPEAPFLEPYGMTVSGERLYRAAMRIGSHSLTGMGGFTDLPSGVEPSDVYYTVALAVAASTRP